MLGRSFGCPVPKAFLSLDQPLLNKPLFAGEEVLMDHILGFAKIHDFSEPGPRSQSSGVLC